jgi:polyisoprenoid-binding protein YceI
MLMISLTGTAIAGEKYDVDKSHSFIGFTVRHMTVASVRGEFKEYAAELTVDESDLANSSIEVTIEAASIDTDNQQRDDHLRSADFLEVGTYPQIVFESKEIEPAGDGEYRAIGDLTIHGVTREVVLDLEVAGPIQDPYGNLRVGVEGETTINRQDFEVKWSKVMDTGGLVVGDDVKIRFALEAMRKPG